jgi:hypothetical protein
MTRHCQQRSIFRNAITIKPKKFMSDFSYRTASRRFSFSVPNIHSVSPRFLYFSLSYSISFGPFSPVLPTGDYSASPSKELTNICDSGKISFGRIFGCAENSGVSGVPPHRMAYGPAPRPMATCGGPAPPEANPQRL